MKWLFTIFATLSLILFLAFATLRLWAPHNKEWNYHAEDRRYSLRHSPRWVVLIVDEGRRRPYQHGSETRYSFGGKLMDTSWQRTDQLPLGISYGRSPVDSVGAHPRLRYYRQLSIPASLLLVTTAILPALWILISVPVIRRRRRAARLHLCLKCGYDLRGSADRCPRVRHHDSRRKLPPPVNLTEPLPPHNVPLLSSRRAFTRRHFFGQGITGI